MIKFNERIKKLRKEKGLNQIEFAKIFEVAQTTVSKWENKEREVSFGMLIKIADFFKVSTDYLLGKSDIP